VYRGSGLEKGSVSSIASATFATPSPPEQGFREQRPQGFATWARSTTILFATTGSVRKLPVDPAILSIRESVLAIAFDGLSP
jgi:hypothetical protein